MVRASVVEEAAEINAAADTECQENDQEDRISKLPDDILKLVLNKLQPGDIAMAAVVSKRWRHLTNIRPNIMIDVDHFIDERSDNTYEKLVRNNVFVVEAVKRILPHSHQSQDTLNRLGIRFYLIDESIDIVGSVDNAMARRKVIKAEFVIITELPDEYNTDDDMVDYGRRLMTFVDAFPRAFGGLTHLSLHSVRLGISDFSKMLDTCKKLEYLSLNNCDAGNKSVLEIEHSQLAELIISSCALERTELIWLPRLTHLTCENWLPSHDEYPLSFHHVPQLRVLTLNIAGTTMHRTFVLSEFLGNTMISELNFNFVCQRIWIQPEGPKLLAPKLQNLQILKIRFIHEECDLGWTMFFLEAAPLLKEVIIQVWDHLCYPIDDTMQQVYQKASDLLLNWETRDDFKHYNMRRLTVEGFQMEKFTKYIRGLVEAAVNLELVTLRESRRCGRCQFCPSRAYPRTDEERNLTMKQIPDRKSLSIKID